MNLPTLKVPSGECWRAPDDPGSINLTAIVTTFTAVVPVTVGRVEGRGARLAGRKAGILVA